MHHHLAVAAAVGMGIISPLNGASIPLAGGMVLERRPYINARGQACVAMFTGQLDNNGQPVMRERVISTNATLRKDEWVRIDATVIKAAQERLVIADDLRAAGLVHNVGGLGVLISEWEKQGEMTDAEITMDGESQADQDRVEFGINGVPIPVIQKPFRIGERTLLASRTRGSGLDVSNGEAAARSVARTVENMIFFGTSIGTTISDGNTYSIVGLKNFSQRALGTMRDWADAGTTPEEILEDILGFVQVMETQHFRFGPFTLYVPGVYAYRFREDFKANSDKTLMQRVMDSGVIKAIRFSDVLAAGDVFLVDLRSDVIDLAMASDLTTIQWSSPSGWTNFFQVFTAVAPRLKADYDGHVGILHATIGT